MLTVVIPAYRAAGVIENALNSLSASTAVESITVVEDGNFDNLEHVVGGYRSVSVLKKEVNGGASSARQYALERCTTEYVFFLDADDYVDSSILDSLLAELETSGADIAFGPWCFVYDGVAGAKKVPAIKDCISVVAGWLRSEAFPTCCVMWRTNSLRNIGGWDPSFRHNDDAELVIRAMMRGLKLAVTDQGCGYYVQHDSPDRVSRAAGAVASEAANRIFEQVVSWREGMTDADLQFALGAFAYEQARRAHRSGEAELGDMWLGRSRDLGVHGHPGSRSHGFLSKLIGLGRKERIASFRDRIAVLRHRYP